MNADDIIEEIAVQLERSHFMDIQGIRAKRKREREDANLRALVRQEQRREIARWVRSYKSCGGNSYAAALENIQDNPFAFGPNVAAAIVVRHAKLKVSIVLDTALANCHPVYEIELTDEGRAIMEPQKAAE